jgi:hypothetical protein
LVGKKAAGADLAVQLILAEDVPHAYAMAGDTAKAKAAYNDFLTLWRDTDLDIPILKEAKAELVRPDRCLEIRFPLSISN